MRIVDVRTVLLTGPSTNDPYLGRTRRSAAFIEILTDTELTGLGETYAGYFIPEAVPSIVDFYRPILLDQTVDDVPALAARLFHTGRYWARTGLGLAVMTGIEAALWDLRGRELGSRSTSCSAASATTASSATRPVPGRSTRSPGWRTVTGASTPDGEEYAFTEPAEAADFEGDKFAFVRGHVGPDVEGAARRPPGQPVHPRVGGADSAGRREGGRAVRPVPVRGAAPLHQPVGLRRAARRDERPDRRRRDADRRPRVARLRRGGRLRHRPAGRGVLRRARRVPADRRAVRVAWPEDRDPRLGRRWRADAEHPRGVRGPEHRHLRDPARLRAAPFGARRRLVRDARRPGPATGDAGLGVTLSAEVRERYPFVPGSGEFNPPASRSRTLAIQNWSAKLGMLRARPSKVAPEGHPVASDGEGGELRSDEQRGDAGDGEPHPAQGEGRSRADLLGDETDDRARRPASSPSTASRTGRPSGRAAAPARSPGSGSGSPPRR